MEPSGEQVGLWSSPGYNISHDWIIILTTTSPSRLFKSAMARSFFPLLINTTVHSHAPEISFNIDWLPVLRPL